MSQHTFTVTVHTNEDRLAARKILNELIHGDVVTPSAWAELLDSGPDTDTYITLDEEYSR